MTSNLADMTPAPRSPRTFINNLYGGFIDEYLSTYKSLSGQAGARNKLVAEIMAAAKTRIALGSEGVQAKAVKKRLGNALAKENRKAKVPEDEEAEAEEAEGGQE